MLLFHNIFKYMVFQRRQKALLWSKGSIIHILFIKISKPFEDFKNFFLLQLDT